MQCYDDHSQPFVQRRTTIKFLNTTAKVASILRQNFEKTNFPFSLELILTITETWGDSHYCGLTGIEVVDINDVDCMIQSYDARPRDVTILPSNSHDSRTLDK